MLSNTNHKFRGLGVQRFRPQPEKSLNACKPLFIRVSGVLAQGFNKVPGIHTPASPYPYGFETFTTYQCSKEHARTGVRHASTLLSFRARVTHLTR